MKAKKTQNNLLNYICIYKSRERELYQNNSPINRSDQKTQNGGKKSKPPDDIMLGGADESKPKSVKHVFSKRRSKHTSSFIIACEVFNLFAYLFIYLFMLVGSISYTDAQHGKCPQKLQFAMSLVFRCRG